MPARRRQDKAAEPSPDAAPAALMHGRVFVVLGLEGVDPAVLPAALGISGYEAAQWARRGGYHLHRPVAAADAAAERERLASLGIRAFTFDPESIWSAAHPDVASGGGYDGAALRLRTRGGPVELAGQDLLLVVKAPIVREHLTKDTLRQTHTATLDPGFRFHLHVHARPRPVEIDPASFHFDARHARGSSLIEVTDWVARLAAGTPVDDAFRRIPPALAPSAPAAGGPAAALEALRSKREPASPILDNVRQFRFYSAWRGAVERALRGS